MTTTTTTLPYITGLTVESSEQSIDRLIAEIEKDVEYLDIFDNQALAQAMMRNAIDSLKKIKNQIVIDKQSKAVPLPYYPPYPDTTKPTPFPSYPKEYNDLIKKYLEKPASPVVMPDPSYWQYQVTCTNPSVTSNANNND